MAALKPPFTATTAREKVKFAQGMWNTRDPSQVAKGYTADCIWRNRDQFIQGTAAIVALLTAKWTNEQDYRLRKELFAVGGDRGERIAVQFWYEYRDRGEGGRWKRCYGLEDWTFDEEGKMKKRMMSGNDILLGKDGDGVADEANGIEGRWYVDGMDVDDAVITEKHW